MLCLCGVQLFVGEWYVLFILCLEETSTTRDPFTGFGGGSRCFVLPLPPFTPSLPRVAGIVGVNLRRRVGMAAFRRWDGVD